jgi:hypothetical protein
MPQQIGRIARNISGLGKQMPQLGFGTEVIYSFVIIICSLMIYFGTKELYELSSHRGIKYFRLAFLFFAIAYFFRSFIKFIIVYLNVPGIFDLNPKIFGILFGTFTLFIFIYFSSMAIFYLLYSVMWKKWNGDKMHYFHLFSLAIAAFITLYKDPLIHLIMNLFLFLIVVFIAYTAYREKHKNNSIYLNYFLLLIFFILNILDILIPKFSQISKLFIYLASSGIFLTILYKVLKKTG